MNYNQCEILNVLKQFHTKLLKEEFVIDKSGVKIIERSPALLKFYPDLGHHIKIENPETGYIFMQSNQQYISLETKWHESMQLNIDMVKHVKIWQQVSGTNGEINSNYGWCVYHPDNGCDGMSQFQHALYKLQQHKESRQAIIFYSRPTMHCDSKKYDMSDFLCTMYNQFLIRNDELNMIYVMKSNDIKFGIPQNLAWAIYVYNHMLHTLQKTYPSLNYGTIHWFVGSIHIYERHFKKLKKFFEGDKL